MLPWTIRAAPKSSISGGVSRGGVQAGRAWAPWARGVVADSLLRIIGSERHGTATVRAAAGGFRSPGPCRCSTGAGVASRRARVLRRPSAPGPLGSYLINSLKAKLKRPETQQIWEISRSANRKSVSSGLLPGYEPKSSVPPGSKRNPFFSRHPRASRKTFWAPRAANPKSFSNGYPHIYIYIYLLFVPLCTYICLYTYV